MLSNHTSRVKTDCIDRIIQKFYSCMKVGVLLLVLPSLLHAGTIEELLQTYPQRQQQYLQSLIQQEEISSPIRGALRLLLQENGDEANLMVRNYEGASSTLERNLFFLRLLYAFPPHSEIFKSSTREKLEKEITNYVKQYIAPIFSTEEEPVYESHIIARNVFLLLWADYVNSASLEYPWPDEGDPESHEQRYRQEVHEWLDFRGRYGFQDRASAYYSLNITALLCLRDFCEDENLKIKADSVIDLMVADIAQESLNGHWGGARCRSFESASLKPGFDFYFLLFGGPENEVDEKLDPSSLHLALSDYRPPPVLVKIGHEWALRGTYEVKTRYCLDLDNPEGGVGRKYSYVTPHYILGSFQTRNEMSPWQSRPWDLLVRGEDDEGYHMFTFTGNQLFSGGSPPYEEEFFLWNTTSFQYKNVLFCKFHRSDRKRAGFQSLTSGIDHRYVKWPTRLWVPNELAPFVEENGWWFAEVGKVYIACRPLTGLAYWWRSGLMQGEENIHAAILTFHDLDTAFLLEVELASNFSSFSEFKNEIHEAPLEVDENWSTYVSRQGDVYLFSLDGERFLVNGEDADPWSDSDYQLYSSPYTKAEYGSGLFRAEWDPYSLEIDLRDPDSPKRVMTQEE